MPEMFGPYRLDGLLGRGGMGEVWRAHDTRKSDRVVALKLLPAHMSDDEEYRARFRREAEIAAVLREPHVVPIHDYGEIDGRLYLDMRLVDGVDLAHVVDKCGALDPERAVTIVEQVAAALDVAHAQGLIHRDVKPRNILIVPGPPEFVYLVDFGIARGARTTSRGRITGTGATVGTMEYMAPERFLGGQMDQRVDVYALACLLFEMLTGQPPYSGEAPALMHGHLSLPVPPLADRRPGLGPAWDDVVARGMAKEPDDRYPSAGALAVAARLALSGTNRSSPVAPIAPPAEDVTKPAATLDAAAATVPTRRVSSTLRRGLAVAAVAAATALAVTAAVVLVQSFRSADGAPIAERVLTGHTDEVETIAAAQLDGRTVAITADDAGDVRVWDVAAGTLVRERMAPGWVNDVALAQIDGRPVVVTAGADAVIQIWDLSTGAPVGRPPVRSAAHPSPVAVTELDGRPVIVAGEDRTIRVWDLASGAAVGSPFVGHTDIVEELTTARLADRVVVVSSSDDGTVRRWDLATGAPLGEPLTGHTEGVKTVAVSELDGRQVVLSGSSDGTVRVWDLETGMPVGEPLRADSGVYEIDVATVHGRTVVVSGEIGGSVQLWDLATRRPSGPPLTGHAGPVWTVGTLTVDGRPVVLSSGEDRTVRIWDLDVRAPD